MGARSRAKGMAWQRELAKRWNDQGLFPGAHSTGCGQARAKTAVGPRPCDVDGTPFNVEAKHHRKGPLGALRQAIADGIARGDERPPIAVVRPHGRGADGAVVVMPIGVFEDLAKCAAGSFTLAHLLEARRSIQEASGQRESAEAAE